MCRAPNLKLTLRENLFTVYIRQEHFWFFKVKIVESHYLFWVFVDYVYLKSLFTSRILRPLNAFIGGSLPENLCIELWNCVETLEHVECFSKRFPSRCGCLHPTAHISKTFSHLDYQTHIFCNVSHYGAIPTTITRQRSCCMDMSAYIPAVCMEIRFSLPYCSPAERYQKVFF